MKRRLWKTKGKENPRKGRSRIFKRKNEGRKLCKDMGKRYLGAGLCVAALLLGGCGLNSLKAGEEVTAPFAVQEEASIEGQAGAGNAGEGQNAEGQAGEGKFEETYSIVDGKRVQVF